MDLIRKYFPSLTGQQFDQFSALVPLYAYWNERINVISRKDIHNLVEHHILHSLTIGCVWKPANGAVIIDAGTGGGFPGIPLAILYPHARFILVDSIAKKIRVVDAIAKETGLTNCETRNVRLEQLKERADYVTCRAVADISTLMGWIGKNLRPGRNGNLKNGLLALKGGELSNEIQPLGPGACVYSLSDYFQEEFFSTKKLVYVPS